MNCAHSKLTKRIDLKQLMCMLKLRIPALRINSACQHTLCSCDVYACVVSLFPMFFQAPQSPLIQPLPSLSLRLPSFARVQSLPVSPTTVPPQLPTQKSSAAKVSHLSKCLHLAPKKKVKKDYHYQTIMLLKNGLNLLKIVMVLLVF